MTSVTRHAKMGTSALSVLVTKGDYWRFNILLSAEQVQFVEELYYTPWHTSDVLSLRSYGLVANTYF